MVIPTEWHGSRASETPLQTLLVPMRKCTQCVLQVSLCVPAFSFVVVLDMIHGISPLSAHPKVLMVDVMLLLFTISLHSFVIPLLSWLNVLYLLSFPEVVLM